MLYFFFKIIQSIQLDILYKKKKYWSIYVVNYFQNLFNILILISYNYTRKIHLRNVTFAQEDKRNITNEKSHALLFPLIMYLFKS